MGADVLQLDDILETLDGGASAGNTALVCRAYEIARGMHQGQVRSDGSPILNHVLRVAANVIAAGERSPEMLAAALLHDIVESTELGVGDLCEQFGPAVARLVDAVTNRPGDSPAESAKRAQMAGNDALLLRLCDRLDGVRHVSGRPPRKRDAFLAATRAVHLVLAERFFPGLGEELRSAIEAAERAH